MEVGTLVGAYRVLERIGEGGMGFVWLVEHTMLGRRAAIKMLHPMYSARPEIVTRFFNEARAATAIADAGIVQIFDFGHHVDGNAYIVMEFLDGEPLDRRLKRIGRLLVGDALRLMRQVASSAGAAHARGIVHRDLKPENIFLVRDSEVPGGERSKIVDFGIAKLLGDQSLKTQTSSVIGTPTYMSPEQCRGAGQIDQRSDVYALGCVLFTLIVGRPPFDADGAGEILAMHLREPPPSPSSRVGGIPPDVDRLVLRCLEKDPARRFSSGSELAAAIGTLLTSASWAGNAPPFEVRSPTAPTFALSTTTLSSGVHASVSTTAPASAARGRWLAFGGALGVAVIAILLIALRGGASTPSAPPPPPSDEHPQIALVMKSVLASFVVWARDHAGAPCPAIEALDTSVQDPWGHAMQLTCSDQPANQIVGIISAGPDGAIGTADDIASWQFGRDVSGIVAGRRWATATTAPTKVAAPEPRPVPSPPVMEPAATEGTQIGESTTTNKKPVNGVAVQPTDVKRVDPRAAGVAEAKPVEAKPAETKPVETKRVETKPVDAKRVEQKPADTKLAETKLAEAKPAEAKLAEAKSAPEVANAANARPETTQPDSKVATTPVAAPPKPRDQRASVFWRNAQSAAQAGDCSKAVSLAARVREIEPAYYSAVNTGEGAIAGCLAAEAKQREEGAEAKRRQEAAEVKRQQDSEPADPKRRVDAFVRQCHTVAERNDCSTARKIAARIAEQYPAVYRERVLTDAAIARCLAAN